MLVLIFITILVIAESIPLIRKKQGKDAAILISLGIITMAYSYYYTTHRYTASMIGMMLKLLNIR